MSTGVGAVAEHPAYDDFVIARNPDGDSSLPWILRIPLGEHGIVLKSRDTWPRTSKVYCHRVEEWPEDAEVVERVPVRSCVRRGAAVDLVLDRGRENRSQLVITQVRGRQAIFWQTARTTKQARPVAVPSARAAGIADLEVLVDSHERYPYTFSDRPVTTLRQTLPAGDYAVRDGDRVVASVERKSLQDLVSSVTTGKLRYQLAELASLPRAALVVEERWSRVFTLEHVRPAVVADGLAECQVRWPSVPLVFCETRKLAQEWTYRYLAAALTAHRQDVAGDAVVGSLATPPPLAPAAPPAPTAATIRAWAQVNGLEVSGRGRVPAHIRAAYDAAHGVARRGSSQE